LEDLMPAAATVNDASFDDFLPDPPQGAFPLPFSVTIATTSLDFADDRTNLVDLLAGRRLVRLDLLSNGAGDAHATPTLDADLVLSQAGAAADAGTETILYNAGARFQAASTLKVATDLDIVTADATDSKPVLRLLVNVAAATPAAMTLSGVLWFLTENGL
jgi:hypothetical protein